MIILNSNINFATMTSQQQQQLDQKQPAKKIYHVCDGRFGKIFTDYLIVNKVTKTISAEIFAPCIKIPNVIEITNIYFTDDNLIYEYEFHPKIFMQHNEICPQDIVNLIIALIRLRKLNLVHMDLKPNNIFYDKNNQIQIADLGGLHHIGPNGYVKNGTGTYYSVSPENILKKQFYVNSQVWSIGICLFHTLSIDQSIIAKYIKDLEPPNPKEVPNVEIDVFENFVKKVKEASLDMTNTKNMSHESLKDFIIKCLTVNRETRPDLEDLLYQPLLVECNIDYKHYNYITAHTYKCNINNIKGIVTQIANMYRNGSILYKLFSIIVHLALTTPLTLQEANAIAIKFCHYNYIDITPENKEIYQKLKGCYIMPGNCIYYCMHSKIELYKFLKTLETTPSIYANLNPIQNFYVPQYIDLLEYLKQ